MAFSDRINQGDGVAIARQWSTRKFYSHLNDGFSNEQAHQLWLPDDLTPTEVEELCQNLKQSLVKNLE